VCVCVCVCVCVRKYTVGGCELLILNNLVKIIFLTSAVRGGIRACGINICSLSATSSIKDNSQIFTHLLHVKLLSE